MNKQSKWCHAEDCPCVTRQEAALCILPSCKLGSDYKKKLFFHGSNKENMTPGPVQQSPSLAKATRHNQGKLRLDLIPWQVTWAFAEVWHYGAKLHGDWNWLKGLTYLSCSASLERHLLKWKSGEDRDAESNCWHMAHVMWNAAVVLFFQIIGRADLDDRQPQSTDTPHE